MVTAVSTTEQDRARVVAAEVADPEMPMLTIADLGVLREVRVDHEGVVVVTITPTYSGCPAMATIRADIEYDLRAHGFTAVRVDTVLSPPWSSDWITPDGRRKLREHGYSPPGPAPTRTGGPIPLTLAAPPRDVRCPHCRSATTELVSPFSATACKALYRCRDCLEPFDHVKEI
ncbi:1,2-phenylacetyl-CoA epoxidase subunit PaaD [Nocardia sp. NPDC046763]|uniref:1,2-phenylacetyl-CoA epoxidase subunit PaaD n=1 Tax=Nocardia sp. NPDC046763 TaxID=3155256 RepID=UPI0033DCF554